MEGANLYDVFQKISKGDYAPLAADRYSAPLRKLVAGMLQVDPNQRPELEQVWAATQHVVSAHKEGPGASASDVHSACEALTSGLQLLAAEVAAQAAGGGSKSSKRPGSSAPGGAPPQLPAALLRELHPLYFAEPLVPRSNGGSDERQQRQMGAFLAVMAWLLRLNGRMELAQQVEALLAQAPASAAAGGGRGGGSARRPAAAASSRSGDIPATLPVCSSAGKGAEAARKAAQAVGVSVEFAPLHALSAGHGRAVVAVLQQLLDITAAKLSLRCRPPVHLPDGTRAAGGGEDEDADVGDADHLEGDPASLITDGAAGGGGDRDEQQEEMYGDDLGDEDAYAALQPTAATASGSAAAQRSGGAASTSAPGGAGGGTQEVITTRVNAAAWRAEVERLAPLLGRIRMPGGGGGGGGGQQYGDWDQRWSQTKEMLGVIGSDLPPASSQLTSLQAGVGGELQRIEGAEERLNARSGHLLQDYKASRSRLERLVEARDALEERVQAGNTALGQISSQLEQAAAKANERMTGLDGSAQIAQAKDAVKQLAADMREMEVRMAVVHSQLLMRQGKELQRGRQLAAAAAADDGAAARQY